MHERKIQAIGNLAAFGLLLLLSAYRQVCMHSSSDSSFYIYVVYCGYLLLIAGWCFSLTARVTQKSFLRCLLAEAAFMAIGMTGRFLQDAFLYHNLRLMRFSGLVLDATLPPILLMGVYAALYMGQEDAFHLPRKSLLLWIPVLMQSALLLVDDYFHFTFYQTSGEEAPNIQFHPGLGLGLFVLSLMGLVVFRVVIIFRKNHMMNHQLLLRLLVSFAEPLILFLFLIPYFLSSMYGTPELIEVFAMLYYIEAVSWEFYIALGLVPVNTAWKEAFASSTLQMQIQSTDGSVVIAAANAMPLSDYQKEHLKTASLVEQADGSELHKYPVLGGTAVYRKDTSLLRETLRKLDETAEDLEQKSGLLAEEIRASNQEVAVKEREQIYDRLRQAVAPQLARMQDLINREQAEREKGDIQANERLRETVQVLCILGTYVKRKCNLLLLQLEHGQMKREDLLLSLEDLFSSCRRTGIQVTLLGRADNCNAPKAESLCLSGTDTGLVYAVYEMTETLLELHEFAVRQLLVTEDEEGVSLQIFPELPPSEDFDYEYSSSDPTFSNNLYFGTICFKNICSAVLETAKACNCLVRVIPGKAVGGIDPMDVLMTMFYKVVLSEQMQTGTDSPRVGGERGV